MNSKIRMNPKVITATLKIRLQKKRAIVETARKGNTK